MRSTNKTILFSRVTVGKNVEQHPVAVFAKDQDARAYAALINSAHRTGNKELAIQLDPQTALTDQGELVPGVTFSKLDVPYAPTLADSGDDLFSEADKPAA